MFSCWRYVELQVHQHELRAACLRITSPLMPHVRFHLEAQMKETILTLD